MEINARCDYEAAIGSKEYRHTCNIAISKKKIVGNWSEFCKFNSSGKNNTDRQTGEV
jgi:hypothetical protein